MAAFSLATVGSAQTPSDPPIEITPVARGISVTSEKQILVELLPEDLDPANPLDLAGRTLMFTPAEGGYTREVRPLEWEEEAADAERMRGPAEVELEHFRFPFAGREWGSFFYAPQGLVSFGKPIPTDYEWPWRFGTMPQMLSRLFAATPMISALFKPHLEGVGHVSNLPDRVVVSFFARDGWFGVYGRRPKETFDFQIVLHSDGRIALNWGPQPQDLYEAFGDGVVGLFGFNITRKERIGSVDHREEPSLPGHLDLLETAIYRTSDPVFALVEFTTREPIRPVPGRELVYALHLDTDRPWSDPGRHRDDRDLYWSVTLRPDGTAEVRGGVVPAPREGDNRIGFLVPLREFGGEAASVAPATGQRTSEGVWSSADGADAPFVVEFPLAGAAVDLSLTDSVSSTAHYEAFRYPMIRDGADGVAHVSCRIIEVLGDAFDFMAFNSQFRVDQQSAGPAHGFAGYYWGNMRAEVEGIGVREDDTTTPCESRLKNTWGYPVWIKAETVVSESDAETPGRTPYSRGLTYFAHEIGHTWLAFADYALNGERRPLKDRAGHWLLGLHAPAPSPREGTENGSVMGGAYWRENGDGTYTPTNGWWTAAGGFSWLDLYLMGLADPDEVPDMFILHKLEQVGDGRDGPYTAEKEIVTMEQVLAAMGPRNPPSGRARKVFNTGFVYFLLPGQQPDSELLREHASYRDRALEHWRHVTGGRGQLTSEVSLDSHPDPEPPPPPPDGECEASAEALCLRDGRFEVKADWWTAGSRPSAALVVPKQTNDSGLFRFFDPANWEILIKVLDGCAVNGHVWVYGASTTDLGYLIRVRDTVTGAVSEYRNEAGEPASAITDNKAFPAACGERGLTTASTDHEAEGRLPHLSQARSPLVSAESGSGCMQSGTALCLADERFEVTVDWSTVDGRRGSGGAVPGGTNNSGLFYFFGSENWEMLIKVLDGCGVNGHHWVYAAAATDLGLDIQVTDTATGSEWTYSKEPGEPAPAITANDAFGETCRP